MVWNLHVCLAGADVAAGLLVFDHWSLLLGGCKLQVTGCRLWVGISLGCGVSFWTFFHVYMLHQNNPVDEIFATLLFV